MDSKFVVNFRVSNRQEIDRGSVVTYANESRLSVIKEHLIIRTDFFVVEEIIDYNNITISNSIDRITTTEDQLIKVVPYLEEIPRIQKPTISKNANKYLRELIQWNDQEVSRRSYPIKDPYLSVISAGIVVNESDFYLDRSIIRDEYNRKNVFALLIPERISSLI